MKYPIKNDIVFNYIFSNKETLKSFLQVVLNKKIDKIILKTQFSLDKLKINDKRYVLDIVSQINDKEIIDVEMQNKPHKNYVERIIIYSGKLQGSILKSGEKYDDAKKVTAISISDFIIFPNINKFHTIWQLREETHTNIVLDGIEFHYIELPKFRISNPDLDDELNQWIALIDSSRKEWLEVVMNKNKKIKEVKKQAEEFISSDEAQFYLDLSKEKWEFDRQCYINDATEIGLKKGLKKGLKEGRKEGRKEGIKEGRKEGRKEGIEVEKIKILKYLLNDNYPVNKIEKMLDIPKDKFKELISK